MLPTFATPHPAVIATPLRDGETVLLHLDTKRYYSLDAAGGQYWRCLVATGIALGDVPEAAQAFLAELLDDGLIEPAATGGTATWPAGTPHLRRYPALAGITFLSGGGVAGPVVL